MVNDETTPFRKLIDPELGPVFAKASRIGVESAWFGHIPFAHWVVGASRPNLLVELGTHNGVSYSAFCDAILENQLQTTAAAIDTWQGDAQAGFYDDTVFDDLKTFHDPRYGAFSSLIRARFDDALTRFDDGTIDLLHIDGAHSYAAVRHDFETWKPKLSERAIVLFHDTQVRRPGYGVWQLWEELCPIYPGFEFLHASGLGVLGVGRHIPFPVAVLLGETDPSTIEVIRDRFATLGARWQREAEIRLLKPQFEAALRAVKEGKEATRQASEAWRRAVDEASRLEAALVQARNREWEALAREHAQERVLVDVRERHDRLALDHQGILASTSWRVTSPLRMLSQRLPRPSRTILRRIVGKSGTHLPAPVSQESTHPPLLHPTCKPEVELPGSMPAEPAKYLPIIKQQDHHKIIYVSGEPNIPGHVYRVERYAEAFVIAGASVTCMRVDEVEHRIAEIATATIVIIWRAVHSPLIEKLILATREAEALLVFDIDDLMFRPELACSDVIDAIRIQKLKESEIADYYLRVQKVLVQADVCFVSTNSLAVHAQSFDQLTHILPNGFDATTLRVSRLAVRTRGEKVKEVPQVLRIGYAAGTRTHQRDFQTAAGAIAQVLTEHPECRLVLFRSNASQEPMFDLSEYAAFAHLQGQIEWRDVVKLRELPNEIARFDINIAPLELGNPFVDAKSELKFFEAALVGVPTVASPTTPMKSAIRDGETGYLAETEADWHRALTNLIENPLVRTTVAHAAYLDVLWRYGPERRAEAARSILRQLEDGPEAARAFELDWRRASMQRPERQPIPKAETMFATDRLGCAEVTIIIPLYNYAHYVKEALDSVFKQTLKSLDLIVIDDASTDTSVINALDWAREHADRFNRLLVVRNYENSGLAYTRNLGFDLSETPFVLPLDADNRLLEQCAEKCLLSLTESNAAYAYPVIRNFGDSDHLIGNRNYTPMRLANANYIDAMALVRKSVWAAVGGFRSIRFGWEDYDFWCHCAEQGFYGTHVNEVLAEYRFHANSMLRTVTDLPDNKVRVIEQLEQHHNWLRLWREP